MKIRMGAPLVALWVMGCETSNLEPPEPPAPFLDRGVLSPPSMVDVGPVRTAATRPPPISGGTLLITRDGMVAVAADPDRDSVSIVSLKDGRVRSTIALERGDEPGRVVEDGQQRVHVALRRGGSVVTIDVATGKVLARRAVCGAPRGIAYESGTDLVHVACAGGDLVSLPAAGGDAVRRVNLDVDLRDVVALPEGLAVSRFKSGDILFVDANGAVSNRASLTPIGRASDQLDADKAPPPDGDPMQPAVAWRTLADPAGGVFVLHQYGFASSIALKPSAPPDSTDPGLVVPDVGNPYGAPAGMCAGLVQSGFSHVGHDSVPRMGKPIIGSVLAVDAALSSDGSWMLVAHAGSPGNALSATKARSVSLTSTDLMAGTSSPMDCAQDTNLFEVQGQSTAVAFNPSVSPDAIASNTWFAVQTREPASLVLFRDVVATNPRVVSLSEDSVLDTGHELFHRDVGGGIACASCHPEGGEDGRVWQFDPIGDRRTQALHVGLEGTEPFHWDGDMTNFGVLIEEVMVHRMGGAELSDERRTALESWLFQLRPPASIVAPTDPGAVRGRTLFESADVGCSSCHSGAKLTNNQTAYVGTGDARQGFQVPSLHGVGFRAPFLHTGCAATLRDRFEPACGGGDRHGKTSQLNDAQVGDLVLYLESL
jgi:DNA-binding beta-propeller fold protein YncE